MKMNVNDLRKLLSAYVEIKDKTPKQEKEYAYFDKALTYASLRQTAIRCGNKNPDDNCMVKDALEKLKKAEKELKECIETV